MQPGLCFGTRHLGVVVVRQLPGKGTVGTVGMERHGLQMQGPIAKGQPAWCFQRQRLR